MQISAGFRAASVYMFQFGQYATNVKSLPPNLPLIQKAQVQISICNVLVVNPSCTSYFRNSFLLIILSLDAI